MQTSQSNNFRSPNNDFNSQGLAPQASNSLSKNSSFSPFLSNTLKVQGASGFPPNSICYSAKHNMIIACPLNRTMQFYDATTLLPLKQRKPQQLDGSVIHISFHSETDTYLMGCTEGSLYMYNASRNELKKLKKRNKCEEQVPAATFLDSSRYVYSYLESKKLFLGTLRNGNLASFGPEKSYIYCLQNLPQRNILLSGLYNGSVAIYRTDRLPHLRVFCSIQAHKDGMQVLTVQSIDIYGKEYILTASVDCTVKLWHLVKGRMRLIRVIRCVKMPVSLVYLENYKMIAIAFESDSTEFWRICSGKLERTFSLCSDDEHSLFLMKEKNMIGVMSSNFDEIELVQLGGGIEGNEKNI